MVLAALAPALAPALLGSISGSGALASLGMNFMKSFGMNVFSQLATMAVDQFVGPGPLGDALKSVITETLGPGLEGNPQTLEGVADRISDKTGMESSEAFSLVEEMKELMDDFLMNFLDNENDKKSAEGKGGKAKSGAAGAEGGGGAEGAGGAESGGLPTSNSWIASLAEALGEILDNSKKLVDLHIDKVSGLGEASFAAEEAGGPNEAGAQLPSATAAMQGEMQQFSMIMNTVNNAIKTSGEGNKTLANKQ